MISDQNRPPQSISQLLEDRWTMLDGGMNSNLDYTILPRNQASRMFNATCRGGFPTQRPAYKSRALNFVNEDVQEAFEEGLWQGGEFYSFGNGVPQLVVSISGRLYSIRMDNFMVKDVTVTGNPNSPLRTEAWFEQAEQWMIVQDGSSSAIIYNGASSRRAVASQREVPVGTAMAYGMGRLWVANGRNFVASDIVGGPSGTSPYGYRDAVLKFTENDVINEGGSFTVPLQSGNITAMAFIANLNTALGQGALIVYTDGAVFSVNPPIDRTQWKNLTYPIQTFAQIEYGSVSQTITSVNGDHFYRSADGIRSLVVKVRDFDEWGNVPVSNEMSDPLDTDDKIWIRYFTSQLFDNRLLSGTVPQKTPRGIVFKGLVALDFNLISTLRTKLPPAYDGVWTGLNILKLIKGRVNGVDRCFAFVVDSSDGKIKLWELTSSEKFDNGTTRVRWSVEGPGLNFGNGGELKQLQSGDLWVDRINGEVDFVARFRPDHSPFWVVWTFFSKCATICDSTDCTTMLTQGREQYRPRIQFPEPPPDCEEANNKPLRNFYDMQVRLEITGYCRLLMQRNFARRLEESAVGQCPADQDCVRQAGCGINDYAYNA